MWQHYRKTFIPIQLAIVVIFVALIVWWKVPPASAVVYLLAMELFSIIGAAWAMRLRGKIARSQGMLPKDRY